MQPSEEIMALEPRQNQPYQSTQEFLWGFTEAKEGAHMVAWRHQLSVRNVLDTLESIDIDDPSVASALGEDTVLEIKVALKMYREHIDNK